MSIKASRDHLIEEFINDHEYKVHKDGSIWRYMIMIIPNTTKAVYAPFRRVDKFNIHDGYRYVQYKGKQLKAHRIVYAALIGPLSDDMAINHINEIKYDNRPSNLELVSHADNNSHNQFGARIHANKFDDETRFEIINLFDAGLRLQEIANRVKAPVAAITMTIHEHRERLSSPEYKFQYYFKKYA